MKLELLWLLAPDLPTSSQLGRGLTLPAWKWVPTLLLGWGLDLPGTLRRSHQQATPTLDCPCWPEECLVLDACTPGLRLRSPPKPWRSHQQATLTLCRPEESPTLSPAWECVSALTALLLGRGLVLGMVLWSWKNRFLTVSTLGGCGSLERTDF